ncbi:hypothetical protein [Tellurirhabdus bombi]|uniref:hypothetical protein n=1 Tax=Tellurirhabdus bombi TaxID=2907205 RepID=UPI001F39BF02|nr:hypothetical protein [Tellurirhabdus bombi]
MTENSKEFCRHFFNWRDRRDLKNLVVRIVLKDAEGKEIHKASVKLPKAKQIGTAKVDGVEKPHYDQPTYFYVDADGEAVTFEYYTVHVVTKSKSFVGVVSEKREDLRGL